MGATVAVLFVPGGKSLSRSELDQVCNILGIGDPLKTLLPTGEDCTYFLQLSTNTKLPESCNTDPSKPVIKLVQGGNDT